MELIKRPRRLRGSANLRKMVRETRMDKSSLIYPLFVMEGNGIQEEIPSMEGQYRYSLDRLPYKLEQLEKAGVNSIMLFGIPDHKDEVGSGAYAQDGIVQKALREAKSRFPEMYYVTDVCMCEYTSHGHCGVLCGHDVDNDKTLELLAKTALSHAQAGSDMIAPSDMMDGRVAAIRKELDLGGYTNIPIMSYAVKYASAFYGPFRDAAGSAPAFGDRKSYQMDFHNRREGMKEALMDIEEGADIIMVKPAMSYLDMVSEISKAVNVPVAAYSVSGEYAMVKAAAKMGWIDEERIIGEMAVGAYRAGAQIYITYFAEEIAKMMEEGRSDMSIRYDGYILDKNYSFMELNEIMKKFRKIAVNYCEKAILEQTVYQFLYFYHFREIHSDVRIKELIEKAKDINDPLKKLWEYTLEEDWSGLYFQTHLYLAHEIDEFNRFPNIMNAEFDYRCELVFFPTKAGILAMYFGNDKVRYMLESTKYLKKFFYQNSTERPENISEKEWNYRLETWEKALAPDYIPINHGFQVQLFDTKHIMYTKDLSGIDLPSPETMINGLKGTYKEEEHLPNYPKQGSIIDYMEFYKSQTFKDWQKNVEKDIRKKCHFFTDKSMLSKIIH